MTVPSRYGGAGRDSEPAAAASRVPTDAGGWAGGAVDGRPGTDGPEVDGRRGGPLVWVMLSHGERVMGHGGGAELRR